jgi:probable rRNA maturation factor
MSRISIASPQVTVAVDRARIREIARTVLEGEGISQAEISIAFVDNDTIRTLNNRYLRHDEPTDVLSFPLGDGKGRPSGEVVIGAEVALAQAAARGHAADAELALYVIHGLLHLCGYDDVEPAAARELGERERHYLEMLGLPAISPAREE